MSRTYRSILHLNKCRLYSHNREFKVEIWKLRSSSLNSISISQQCLYIDEDRYKVRVRHYSHRYPAYTNPRYDERYPAALYEKSFSPYKTKAKYKRIVQM